MTNALPEISSNPSQTTVSEADDLLGLATISFFFQELYTFPENLEFGEAF